MADAVQKGIEAAQQDLVKDAEEKLLEEVNGIFDVKSIFEIRECVLFKFVAKAEIACGRQRACLKFVLFFSVLAVVCLPVSVTVIMKVNT